MMLLEFLKYYRPYKKVALFIVLGSFLTAFLDLIFPILVRHMLNNEIPAHNIYSIFRMAALLFGLYILNAALLFWISYYGHVMSIKIERDLRRKLFTHLESMSFSFFDNNRTGQLLSRLTSDLTEIGELTFKGPNDVIVCVITMVGTIAILFWMNLRLGLLIGVLLIFKAIHTVIVNKNMKKAFRFNRIKGGDVAAKASEALSAIRLVKAFSNENLETGLLMKVNDEYMTARKKSFKILAYFSSSINFFTNFINLSVLTAGGYLIASGELALSDFIAFLLCVNLFMKPLLRATIFVEMYQRGMAGFSRFYEIICLKPDIVDSPYAIECKEIKGAITFENVTFGYRNGLDVIRNINLSIKQGETVAFVGATGAGKTTLSNLILRFYEPRRGRILIDGVDIRNYTQESLRKKIGVVQQDAVLFSDSVFNNIAYGKPEAEQKEIYSAAAAASAVEFINKLPEKFETEIGERGVKLSGGQKQRLAIARIFLKNPPIVIFDEATSALDNKTEKDIQASLDRLTLDRTTIIIAHRLSTIKNTDRIIVFDNGQIVEEGTHNDLLSLKGRYYKLYQSSE